MDHFSRVFIHRKQSSCRDPSNQVASPYGVSSKIGVCGDRPTTTWKKLFQSPVAPVAPDDLTQHQPNGGQDRRRVVECVNRFEKFSRQLDLRGVLNAAQQNQSCRINKFLKHPTHPTTWRFSIQIKAHRGDDWASSRRVAWNYSRRHQRSAITGQKPGGAWCAVTSPWPQVGRWRDSCGDPMTTPIGTGKTPGVVPGRAARLHRPLLCFEALPSVVNQITRVGDNILVSGMEQDGDLQCSDSGLRDLRSACSIEAAGN